MSKTHSLVFPALCGLGLLLFSAPSEARQAFINNTTDIPQGASNSASCENIDFGDVDQDGDWDAILANGGDAGNDQNRIWINQGGQQMGTTGIFSDDTSARFPSLADDSRDIEFVDLDDDGDLDIYTSNTAQISQQGNRWWINDGGLQGGSLGVYLDDTGNRWVNLGGVGSSIPPGLVIDDGLGNVPPTTTFIDWSCDCDFGDLDNDGDMDLVHSTYGGAFGGQVPTRIFLNDGDGFFEEFNPSNFQIPVQTIVNGNPGIWCEGTQQANTTDSTGTFCDVASSPLDIDVGDTDGDLDLDILHGARQESPRMFENRLEENGGSLGFRDVTGAVYPTGYSTGDGHYEQEFGDMDNDGDLDIYGLNWRAGGFSGFTDIVMPNDGLGNYSSYTELAGSTADDNEGDFIDYDNDGDLDLFVCNFSGRDKLYRNDTTTADNLVLTNVTTAQTPNLSRIGLDADAADVDNDGDYDLFIANDNGAANFYFENTTQTPDTTASSLYRLESVSGGSTSASDEIVRVQVYDNAPYYVTWYNDTVTQLTVDGIAIPRIDMKSSGGQIFRAEIPGNLLGDVEYHVESTDQYGNTGSSSTESYTNTGPGGTLYGLNTPGEQGGPPTLRALTSPYAGKPMYAVGGNVSPGVMTAMAFSTTSASLDLGNGLILNVGLPLIGMLSLAPADSNGQRLVVIRKAPLSLAGTTVYLQFGAQDGVGSAIWASSQGLQLDFQ